MNTTTKEPGHSLCISIRHPLAYGSPIDSGILDRIDRRPLTLSAVYLLRKEKKYSSSDVRLALLGTPE